MSYKDITSKHKSFTYLLRMRTVGDENDKKKVERASISCFLNNYSADSNEITYVSCHINMYMNFILKNLFSLRMRKRLISIFEPMN